MIFANERIQTFCDLTSQQVFQSDNHFTHKHLDTSKHLLLTLQKACSEEGYWRVMNSQIMTSAPTSNCESRISTMNLRRDRMIFPWKILPHSVVVCLKLAFPGFLEWCIESNASVDRLFAVGSFYRVLVSR
jgi:hypothetical protein